MAKEGEEVTQHVDHTAQIDEVDHLVHGKEKWWNWRVLMNLIIVGLALGLFGYDNAFTSPLVSLPLFVAKYQGPGFEGEYVFTARNLDLIITVPLVGAASGAFAAIPLQAKLGRKKSFLIAYFSCSIPGSILQLFAPNVAALIVGRFWNYFGISILTNVGPIYLSELVPARDRARAVGFTVAGSGAVSVIATVVVWGTEHINDARQYMIPLAVQAAAPALFFVLSFLLIESPMWLLSVGRIEEAKRNLASIRANDTRLVEAEISSALISLHSLEENRAQTKFWDVLKPPNLERTLVAGALLCTSQVGGQILVTTYSTVILVQAGVADPFKITILIFLLQFLGTLIGPFLIDKIGRRPVALVLFSVLFLMDIAAGALGCTSLNDSEAIGLAVLCILFSFVNSVSFQSLAYLLPTEIPTARLREHTVAWSLFWSYTTAIITTFAVPQITSADAGNLGAKAFLIFGGCMAVTTVGTYFFLPETANRTLAEIDEMYAAKIPKRSWRGYKTTATAIATAEAREKQLDGRI